MLHDLERRLGCVGVRYLEGEGILASLGLYKAHDPVQFSEAVDESWMASTICTHRCTVNEGGKEGGIPCLRRFRVHPQRRHPNPNLTPAQTKKAASPTPTHPQTSSSTSSGRAKRTPQRTRSCPPFSFLAATVNVKQGPYVYAKGGLTDAGVVEVSRLRLRGGVLSGPDWDGWC